jgi:hypothetical protein
MTAPPAAFAEERIPYPLSPPSADLPTGTPAVVVPPGCVTLAPATVVFEGSAELIRGAFARFQIERVLAGSAEGYAVGDRLDLEYGVDARFLEEGATYIVGAAPSASGDRLTSKVRAPEPLFGGDAVIGVNDNDVDCPIVDDPVRTLAASGQSIDSGLLTPLRGAGADLRHALLTPFLVASAVLLALVAVKLVIWAMFRAVRDEVSGPSSRRPRAGRRRHGSVDEAAAQRVTQG